MRKILLIFLLSLGFCFSSFCFSATNTFDGAVDLDWNDAGNWNTTGVTDRVPIAGDAVVIPDGLAGSVDLDTATIICDTITCVVGGTITCDTAVVTSITGDIISNSTSAAMIISGTGSVTINGDISEDTGSYDIVGLTGAATLIVNGNVTAGSGTSDDAIDIANNDATIIVNGNVTGGTGSASDGISGSATGATIIVTGEIAGGSGASSYGISVINSGTFNLGTLVFANGKSTPISALTTVLTIDAIKVNGTLIGSDEFESGSRDFN